MHSAVGRGDALDLSVVSIPMALFALLTLGGRLELGLAPGLFAVLAGALLRGEKPALSRRLVALGLFGLLLSGVAFAGLYISPASASPTNWPMYGFDAADTRATSDNVPPPLTLKWSFLTGGDVFSSPIIVSLSGIGNVVIFGSADCTVYAIKEDGGVLWTFSADGTTGCGTHPFTGVAETAFWTSPVYGSLLTAETDCPGWITGPGYVCGTTHSTTDMVYLGDGEFFYALNARDGHVVWAEDTSLTTAFHSSAIFLTLPSAEAVCDEDAFPAPTYRQVVVFGADDFNVYMFSARDPDNDQDGDNIDANCDGGLDWPVDPGTFGAGAFDPPTAPAAFSVTGATRIFVADDGGEVSALKLDGTAFWAFQDVTAAGGVEKSPVLLTIPAGPSAGTWLFVGDDEGDLVKINAVSGAILWQSNFGLDILSSPAYATIDGARRVYFGDDDGDLNAVDAEAMVAPGAVWTFTSSAGGAGDMYSSPAVSIPAKAVYFGSIDDSFYAVDALTGAWLWSFRASGGDDFESSPALLGSSPALACIGSDDDRMYCFERPVAGTTLITTTTATTDTTITTTSSVFSPTTTATSTSTVGTSATSTTTVTSTGTTSTTLISSVTSSSFLTTVTASTGTVTGTTTHTATTTATNTATTTATTTGTQTTQTTQTTTATAYTPAPRCIIATAAYGSEASPAVQFLRSFRDGFVLSTRAGSAFMEVFNAWYYSFSPSVAGVIANNEPLRSPVRVLLYPLLGILSLSALTYSIFSGAPDFAIVIAGLVASSLIGLVYLTPFTFVGMRALTKRRNIKVTGLAKGSMILLAAALALLAAGEVVGSFLLLAAASSAVVLICVIAAPTIAALAITRPKPQ